MGVRFQTSTSDDGNFIPNAGHIRRYLFALIQFRFLLTDKMCNHHFGWTLTATITGHVGTAAFTKITLITDSIAHISNRCHRHNIKFG